jgi:hypothetical protein
MISDRLSTQLLVLQDLLSVVIPLVGLSVFKKVRNMRTAASNPLVAHACLASSVRTLVQTRVTVPTPADSAVVYMYNQTVPAS